VWRNTPYDYESKNAVVEEYYNDNHSLGECAKKFSISRPSVRKYVNELSKTRTIQEGIALRDSKMERGGHWEGGRSLGYKPGYMSIYTGVKNGAGTYRTEHLLIAERVLGRKLKYGEVVHHVNGNGLDNRNSNLLICSNSYHVCLHNKMAKLYQQEHFA
jgi:hypothetical protein